MARTVPASILRRTINVNDDTTVFALNSPGKRPASENGTSVIDEAKRRRPENGLPRNKDEFSLWSKVPIFCYHFYCQSRGLPIDALRGIGEHNLVCHEVPQIVLGFPMLVSFLMDSKIPFDDLPSDNLGWDFSTHADCDLVVTKRYYSHAFARPLGSIVRIIWSACTKEGMPLRSLVSYRIEPGATIPVKPYSEDPTSHVQTDEDLSPCSTQNRKIAVMEAPRVGDTQRYERNALIARAAAQLKPAARNAVTSDSDAAECTVLSVCSSLNDAVGPNPHLSHRPPPHKDRPQSKTDADADVVPIISAWSQNTGAVRTVYSPGVSTELPARELRLGNVSESSTSNISPFPGWPESSHVLSVSEKDRRKDEGSDTRCEMLENVIRLLRRLLEEMEKRSTSTLKLSDPRNKHFFECLCGITAGLSDEQVEVYHAQMLLPAFRCANQLMSERRSSVVDQADSVKPT